MTHAPLHLHTANRTAFTLVELMISIALVVLLILGVNQVFLYTSQAVGSGQAINDAIREGQSIQKTLGDDLANAVPNGHDANSSAALVIASTSTYGYRNAADLAADRDGNPATYDLLGDGVETDAGDSVSPLTYNFRNHRTDTLSFFARGKYPRQTGGSGTTGAFVANMSSDEAWVWYGHLQLPDNSAPDATTGAVAPANFYGPGAQSPAVNPNNFFANGFVLGREAILLRPPEPNTGNGNDTTTDVIYNNQVGKAAQPHISMTGTQPYWALSPTATASDASGFRLPASRYDLAAGTIPLTQSNLVAWLQSSDTASVNWWTANTYNHTFECDPFVPKPLTPQGMAQALPYFVRGCSQFTVEFAGDFVTQNNDPTDATYNNATDTRAGKPDLVEPYKVKPSDGIYGDVITRGGDGVLDYFIDRSADLNYVNGNPISTWNPALWQRHIRWYGLPRDDNNDGVINGFAGTFNTVTPTVVLNQSNNSLLDVVPVRDVVATSVHSELLPAGYAGESFEHFPTPDQLSAVGVNNPIATAHLNYASIAPIGTPPTNIAAYTAAFGPLDPRVRLIRVTVTLEDPTGRLRDGQTYQYVFPVGAK